MQGTGRVPCLGYLSRDFGSHGSAHANTSRQHLRNGGAQQALTADVSKDLSALLKNEPSKGDIDFQTPEVTLGDFLLVLK